VCFHRQAAVKVDSYLVLNTYVYVCVLQLLGYEAAAETIVNSLNALQIDFRAKLSALYRKGRKTN